MASAIGQFLIFLAVVLGVVTALHYYLWRRLVRDTTAPGRARRILTWVLVGLIVLVLSTFVGTRLLPHAIGTALSWAGYLWLALMFYLFVLLLVLEVPALIARQVWRQKERSAALVAVPVGAAVPGPAGSKPPPVGRSPTRRSPEKRRPRRGRAGGCSSPGRSRSPPESPQSASSEPAWDRPWVCRN